MRLTDITVRTLPTPPSGAKIHHDDSLTGFGVRVTSTGVKSFVLTYGVNRDRITIGRYSIIGLAEARAEAKRILAEQTLGKHRPVRLKASETLSRFLVEQTEKNRAITVRYTEALIRNHFPRVLNKTLEDVRTDDVTGVNAGAKMHRRAGVRIHHG
jgi:hypothetical protein